MRRIVDDNGDIMSEDSQIFEVTLPERKDQTLEAVGDNENMSEISALLMNTTNSYDTLKLFKTKSKSSSDDSRSSEKVRLKQLYLT